MMLAIMRDASNRRGCQQIMRCTIKNTQRQRPWTMSAITHDLSNHERWQQKHSMAATTHDTVDKLNEQLLASMNSEVFTVYSANKVVDEERPVLLNTSIQSIFQTF